jgi:hypothetical protein
MLGELLTELDNHRMEHEAALAAPAAASFILFSTEFYEGANKRFVGGFADRLKGLLTSALLAILTDRVFLTEWVSPSGISEYFEAPRIAWNRLEILAGAPSDAFVVDAIDNDNHAAFDRYLSARQDSGELFDGKAVARVHANILGIGDLLAKKELLQRTRFGRLMRRHLDRAPRAAVARDLASVLFNYLLGYRPRRRAIAIWRDFHERRRNGPVIGVHFRSGGDGAWWDPVVDDVGRAPAMREAIAHVAEQHFGGHAQVLVASDSLAFRQRLCDLVAPHWPVHSYAGEIRHFERSAEEALAGGDFAVAEFMCLSRCDYVIHGRGGFGSTAALVGAKPCVAYEDLIA